jgi:hypothetical protein
MNTELPRIETVSPRAGKTLALVWAGRGEDVVDLSGWIATGGDALRVLDKPDIFRTATLVDYGTAIQWTDDEDLAIDAYHLSLLANQQRPLDTQELLTWQEHIGLSNNEAADFFGLALSTWNAYRAGAAVPASVQMLCRAAERDPLLLAAHYRPRKPGRPAAVGH